MVPGGSVSANMAVRLAGFSSCATTPATLAGDWFCSHAQQRAEMAKRVYSAQMETALDAIPARLDALWNSRRYRRRERRRIIFLLWDEADSSAAGKSAAKIIEKWIRRRLPPGSVRAYTDAALEAFARERVGRPPFRPYGSLLEMRAS